MSTPLEICKSRIVLTPKREPLDLTGFSRNSRGRLIEEVWDDGTQRRVAMLTDEGSFVFIASSNPDDPELGLVYDIDDYPPSGEWFPFEGEVTLISVTP